MFGNSDKDENNMAARDRDPNTLARDVVFVPANRSRIPFRMQLPDNPNDAGHRVSTRIVDLLESTFGVRYAASKEQVVDSRTMEHHHLEPGEYNFVFIHGGIVGAPMLTAYWR